MSLQSYAWRQTAAHVLSAATHCGLCGKPLDFEATPRSRWSPSVDHIIPRALGGSDALSNLQPAHYGCNSGRGAKPPPPMAQTRQWLRP